VIVSVLVVSAGWNGPSIARLLCGGGWRSSENSNRVHVCHFVGECPTGGGWRSRTDIHVSCRAALSG
jgi:hypothetical protein